MADDKPPFDTIRAAFILLTGLIAVELAVTGWGAAVCFQMIYAGRIEVGGCSTISTTIREIWSEALSAILALLLAARQGPPRPPDDPH